MEYFRIPHLDRSNNPRDLLVIYLFSCCVFIIVSPLCKYSQFDILNYRNMILVISGVNLGNSAIG